MTDKSSMPIIRYVIVSALLAIGIGCVHGAEEEGRHGPGHEILLRASKIEDLHRRLDVIRTAQLGDGDIGRTLDDMFKSSDDQYRKSGAILICTYNRGKWKRVDSEKLLDLYGKGKISDVEFCDFITWIPSGEFVDMNVAIVENVLGAYDKHASNKDFPIDGIIDALFRVPQGHAKYDRVQLLARNIVADVPRVFDWEQKDRASKFLGSSERHDPISVELRKNRTEPPPKANIP